MRDGLVFYWKKSEVHDLFASTGVQFPIASKQDGLMHSIFDEYSPVKMMNNALSYAK